MKNKIDNILLISLWLIASTLGVCFWFNSQFGFNIFSHRHWNHLAYLQANQASVKTTFYVSIVFSVVFVIYGLYILAKPRFRKIHIPQTSAPHNVSEPSVASETVAPAPTQNPPVLHTEQNTPQPQKTDVQISEQNLTRPARLNLPPGAQRPAPALSIPGTAPVAPVAPVASPVPSAPASQWPEIAQIFTDTGYIVKDSPRVGSIQTALLAIGLNETLYIGGVNIETTQLQTVIDHLNQVFTDTLEDIYITVNGFVINALDASSPGAPEIMLFDNIDSLRNYMNEHPNPAISDDDAENFDAFSSYISTVLEYLRKM